LEKGLLMRNRLFVLGVVVALAVGLGIPAAARAATETAPVLTDQGCGSLWNPGSSPDGEHTGRYAVVNHSGSYQLTFASQATLDGNPGYVPNFCDLSISNKSGEFEIADPNDANSDGDACLAVDSSGVYVVDDTPAACNTQEYSWDEWQAVSDGTYHSNTEWQFINEWDGGIYCLTDEGDIAYWAACNTGPAYEQQFVWSNSGL
jgi:hypothetical protein